jgi:hypothetical protein
MPGSATLPVCLLILVNNRRIGVAGEEMGVRERALLPKRCDLR